MSDSVDISGSVMDASGSVVDVSGSVTDVSGSVTDVSGSVMDVSGSVVDVPVLDVSGSVVDVSGSVVDVSGSVMDVSGGSMGPSPIYLSDLSGGTPPPPRILLSDILGQLSVLQQQEANDRAMFVPPNVNDIRNRLIPWVAGGMQGSCDLARVWMTPPNICSDGVSRNFFDYIAFVSGKTVAEHLKAYQDLLPEFEVGYRCSRTELVICVVRVLTVS